MKTNLLTLGFALLSFMGLSQQQIDNSGFENWDNVGTNNEEPTNWNSFMTASGGYAWAAGQQIEQSTDAHSGTYSCRIYSTSTFGIVANGNVTVGQVNMGSTTPNDPANYNITRTGDPDFHQVLTDEPDSLVFWAKFTPVDGNDSARVSATIHDNYDYRDPEDAASSNEVVAKAVSNLPTTGGQWQRFSFPFDYASYTGNNTIAEYILITFTTNKIPGGGSANDEVLVDDVELIYNIPEVNITPATTQTILVNDPGNDLTANESPVPATSREWKFTTTSGTGYQSFAPVETGATYTPQFANTGTYYVIVESVINGNTVVSNEVEINVVDQPEVTITPAANQSILINIDGDELTANETPAGTSREWKFSTTSGTGYQSFGTPETGMTYTPNFATAGTYYVIVESIINGNTLMSNEIEINVVDQPEVTITPAANQSIIVNIDGDELTANETPAGTSREWKFSTTSGTGYQSFGTPETGMTYTPNFANVGVYYVIVESDINATTYTSNEVMIDVTEPISTSNPTWKSIKVYAYGQNVIVDLNDVNLESGDFVLYNTNGQEVFNQLLKNQQTKFNVTLPDGIYFYQIIDGAQSAQGKIYLGH